MEEIIIDKIERILKDFGMENLDVYKCSGIIYREIKEYLKN